MRFPPPRGSTRQAWLEEVPAESRGLRIIEVVFFLITYKNRDKANHQPCDLLQVSGSLNSLKKARISTFPTAWYFELQSSLSTILLWEGEGGREKKYYLNALIKWRPSLHYHARAQGMCLCVSTLSEHFENVCLLYFLVDEA